MLRVRRGERKSAILETAFSRVSQTRNVDLNYCRFPAKHRSRITTSPYGAEIQRDLMGEQTVASLTINGKAFEVDVEMDTPLLWAIRENVGLTGTKYGCGIAQCGACTVHIDGAATRSCGVLVSEAVGNQITTLEGLAPGGTPPKLQPPPLHHPLPP